MRTRVAGAVAGTAFAGLTALAVGAAAPAGAQQQVRPANQVVSTTAPQHATYYGCDYWDDDCDWGYYGGDGWYGGWYGW
jgi:hypothetical protein